LNLTAMLTRVLHRRDIGNLLVKVAKSGNFWPYSATVESLEFRGIRLLNPFIYKGFRLEAEEGIEPSNDGFANHCLTTWLLRHGAPAGGGTLMGGSEGCQCPDSIFEKREKELSNRESIFPSHWFALKHSDGIWHERCCLMFVATDIYRSGQMILGFWVS